MSATPRPELSRPLQLATLSPQGFATVVEPGAEERSAVARRLDLVALESLRAELKVAPRGRGKKLKIVVSGRIQAVVVQSCVVTLEPVPATVDAPIERFFATEAAPVAEVDIDPDAPDIEPLPDDELDLGELVVEELSLALDPYPRVPDAQTRLAEALARAAVGGDDTPEQSPRS